MVLRLEDELREDALGAVRTLQTLGVYVAMLTGDERKAAEAVAQTLGIEERLVNRGWYVCCFRWPRNYVKLVWFPKVSSIFDSSYSELSDLKMAMFRSDQKGRNMQQSLAFSGEKSPEVFELQPSTLSFRRSKMTPGDKENWIRGGEYDLENGLSTPLLNVAPKAHFVGREGRSPPSK